MEYYYKIYGLIIKSEIELPEAYEIAEQTAEVDIKYGAMPEFVREKRELDYYFGILNKEYKWFYLKGLGDFLIEKGTKITVELELEADEKLIRAFVLGICLASILHQREIICIHSSAIVWNDKAIIISGASGAGKSTISAEFRKNGCLFLADDTVAVTNEDGFIYANPAYPQQKLCTDAAIEFGYDLNNLILLSEEREKYAIRLKDAFCADRKEVAALVCLEVLDGDQLVIEEVTGSAKLEYIINNLYTYQDFNYFGMNTNVFKKCLEMAQKVPILRVKRPPNYKAVAQIVDQVISMIENKNRIKEYK